ncbi:MAG: hypothetical protein FWE14_04880 [Lachnospiraceae bacterium]|nr:hypothetical protein [Lachnospiraceae bacterium]
MANRNYTQKIRTASGYDTLYPKTTASQILTDSNNQFISAAEKNKIANDFILTNQQNLTFTNLTAIISDSRITANSLADVYFTAATITIASAAEVSVETYTGRIELTAKNTPSGTVTATIRIRVI